MSVVTNVILTAMHDCIANELNAFLEAGDFGRLLPVDKHAGGRKAMECSVWMGAFNYLDRGELAAAYSAAIARWDKRHPHGVRHRLQLFICEQDDAGFRELAIEPG